MSKLFLLATLLYTSSFFTNDIPDSQIEPLQEQQITEKGNIDARIIEDAEGF